MTKATKQRAKRGSAPKKGEPAFLCLVCHRAFRSGYEVSEHLKARADCRERRASMSREDRNAAQLVNTKLRRSKGWAVQKRQNGAAKKYNMGDLVVKRMAKRALKVNAPGFKGWMFCPNCGTDIRKGRSA